MPPVLVILSAIIFLVKMVSADKISLGTYRRGYRVPDDAPEWMTTSKYRDIHLYNEPLYANADPSLQIHRAKEIAIIGEYLDASEQLRHGSHAEY
jgi:hypothetical protein